MKKLWFRFLVRWFLSGWWDVNVCPNCGFRMRPAPGNWPRKEQARINQDHWKECEA